MTARKVTYADIDAFLVRLGLVRRSVEVGHGAGNVEVNGADGAVHAPRPARGYAYGHAETGALLMLPKRSAEDEVAPQYVHAVRRTLVDWGVISDGEFDRWLCQTRFPNAQSAPTNVGVTQARATG